MAKREKPPRRKYTAAEMIAVLESTAGNKSLAATRLRCARSTIDCYVAEYPEIAEALARIRAEFVDLAETQLKILVKERHPQAVFFALKTLARDQGYSERTEITTPPGKPIELKARFDYSKLQTEELRLLHALLARAAGRPSILDDELVADGLLPAWDPARRPS